MKQQRTKNEFKEEHDRYQWRKSLCVLIERDGRKQIRSILALKRTLVLYCFRSKKPQEIIHFLIAHF